jgi:chromosome segregation ATPase
LKNLFETEKIRFEEKLKEERYKSEKKLKNNTEEYESKLQELERELKEEIENLNNDLQAEINNHNDYVSHAEHEIGLLRQKIETLEHFLNEAREALNAVQTQSSQQLEKEAENYKKDKIEYQTKIDTLTLENNNKDKEITSLKTKKEQLETLIVEKEAALLNLKKELEEDKRDLMTKMENYKTKFTESNDDFMLKKLEFIRESALLKQQVRNG